MAVLCLVCESESIPKHTKAFAIYCTWDVTSVCTGAYQSAHDVQRPCPTNVHKGHRPFLKSTAACRHEALPPPWRPKVACARSPMRSKAVSLPQAESSTPADACRRQTSKRPGAAFSLVVGERPPFVAISRMATKTDCPFAQTPIRHPLVPSSAKSSLRAHGSMGMEKEGPLLSRVMCDWHVQHAVCVYLLVVFSLSKREYSIVDCVDYAGI